MNEKECRKLAKELNEKSHYDFKIRKYADNIIILSYNGGLGVVYKKQCSSFEHVSSLIEKLTK